MSRFNSITDMWRETLDTGDRIFPRGEEVRELRDTQFVFDSEFPFQDHPERKYKLEYFKREMRWKLGASKFDDSIKSHAKMWESVQNPDGTFNSNYGQYWFGEQMGIWKVLMELVRDTDSRRATIPMLTDAHLSPHTRDTVCTEAVTWHIRDMALKMSVHMRSSDQVFGLGTDCPTFATMHHLLHGLLLAYYPNLKLSLITITAASSHIYSRHFDMVKRILKGPQSYPTTKLPACSGPDEAMAIIAYRGKLDVSEANWRLAEFLHD